MEKKNVYTNLKDGEIEISIPIKPLDQTSFLVILNSLIQKYTINGGMPSRELTLKELCNIWETAFPVIVVVCTNLTTDVEVENLSEKFSNLEYIKPNLDYNLEDFHS